MNWGKERRDSRSRNKRQFKDGSGSNKKVNMIKLSEKKSFEITAGNKIKK